MSDKDSKPHRTLEGNLVAGDARFAIVASRFNDFLVSKLVEGALDGSKRHGGDTRKTTPVWGPGASEPPQVEKKRGESASSDAVICPGAIVTPTTLHCTCVV